MKRFILILIMASPAFGLAEDFKLSPNRGDVLEAKSSMAIRESLRGWTGFGKGAQVGELKAGDRVILLNSKYYPGSGLYVEVCDPRESIEITEENVSCTPVWAFAGKKIANRFDSESLFNVVK